MPFSPANPLRLFICWTHISGYVTACWRRLQAVDRVDLAISAFPTPASETATQFDSRLVEGLACRLLSPAERADYDCVRSVVLNHRPDVVIVPGWAIPAYRRLAREPALAGARFLMAMDTPWRGGWRQRLGRFKIGALLARLDGVLVPGERAWQFARHLGVPASKIRRGSYGFDYDLVSSLHGRRAGLPSGWPRRFLFVGRYVKEKAIDALMAGYAAYRRATPDPWPLTCCGCGPLGSLMRDVPGIEDRGFVQPGDLPEVFVEHGAFVLPSRFEPWGVALAEAVGAGLPVVASEACGSIVELVRPYYNGLVTPTGDPAALAAALRWIHHHAAELPAMGERGQPLAAAYGTEAWRDKMLNYLDELFDPPAI